MKKLFLSLTLIAFAAAVQAGDATTTQAPDQGKPACCAKAKAAGDQSKGQCPMMAKQADGCCWHNDKASCPLGTAPKQALLTPKEASK
jgi:hypothetical protein